MTYKEAKKIIAEQNMNNKEKAFYYELCEKDDRLSKEPELRKELLNLKGKNLGCWCKPERCHGDTLIECINELSENK